MKTFSTNFISLSKSRLLIAICLVIPFISCSPEENSDKATSTQNISINYSESETKLMGLINEYRASIGLNSLAISNHASYQSELHNDFMIEAGQISHDQFSSRRNYLINAENASNVSENVAYGYNTPEQTLDAWLKSSGHKSVIENSTHTHFGLSIKADANGRLYYTSIYIRK